MTRRGALPGKRGAAPDAAAAESEPGAAKLPAKSLHRVTDLDQMRTLADPLRIRILELLSEERTTKQVADILGQPPTRLYHHVAALERVGLVRLTRTRQRRGALEKYYHAVARAFSADPRLFTSGPSGQARQAAQDMAGQVLENTISDLQALLERGPGPQVLQQEGLLSYLEVRGSAKELKAIRAKLMKLIEGEARRDSKTSAEGASYRLTIAFFPLAAGRRPR